MRDSRSGLGDAYRSVYYAPSSATAQNTLGTVLGAMGAVADSRRAYERALALDPRAAYVLNNLCYLSFLEGAIAAAGQLHAALDVILGWRPPGTTSRSRTPRTSGKTCHGASSWPPVTWRPARTTSASLPGRKALHTWRRSAFAAAQLQRPSWAAAG